jgi:hypothetical protein
MGSLGHVGDRGAGHRFGRRRLDRQQRQHGFAVRAVPFTGLHDLPPGQEDCQRTDALGLLRLVQRVVTVGLTRQSVCVGDLEAR